MEDLILNITVFDNICIVKLYSCVKIYRQNITATEDIGQKVTDLKNMVPINLAFETTVHLAVSYLPES